MGLRELLSHPIVVEMVVNGIEPVITAGGLKIEGFYKSGAILLHERDGKLFASSRYDRVDEIESLKDLANLNLEWWKYSKKTTPLIVPDSKWLDLLLRYGMVEEVVIETKEYRSK